MGGVVVVGVALVDAVDFEKFLLVLRADQIRRGCPQLLLLVLMLYVAFLRRTLGQSG